MAEEQKAPSAREAATVLLVRDAPFEVLMVERHAEAHYAAALVFPGGTVDADDASPDWLPHVTGAEGLSEGERALRIAAYRETFEEVALLLTAGQARSATPADGSKSFLEVVRASGGVLALDQMLPFGHWVTPAVTPKRFDTHFYLHQVPAGLEAVCDGGETVRLEWTAPKTALALAEAGERAILFPTRMNLTRLAESADAQSALNAARARPVFTVRPEVERSENGVLLRIPAEAGYGITEAWQPSVDRSRR
jgi:8-oxo-dGTP pyrophosphatase MutT (NUDIX family)